MIYSVNRSDGVSTLFQAEEIEHRIAEASNALIKVNLARPPEKGKHPRSDPTVLLELIEYLTGTGKSVTLCESCDGNLHRNLESIGILSRAAARGVEFIDIDQEEYLVVSVEGQNIAIPRFFEEYELRISLPCASKREGMLFSNNVKNFFGATPRQEYLRDGEGRWRSKLHDDLTNSVIRVYKAFQRHAPFHLYVNGGNVYSETSGPFVLDRLFASDDAVALDNRIFDTYFHHDEYPEYLSCLSAPRV